MKLSYIIEAIQPAYLYHAVSLSEFYDICKQLKINPVSPYGGEEEAISLTRNKRLNYGETGYGRGEVMLVIDRTKLAHTTKIKPYNWFDSERGKKANLAPPEELSNVPNELAQQFKHKFETEERVYEPIPFHSGCIVEIIVDIHNINESLKIDNKKVTTREKMDIIQLYPSIEDWLTQNDRKYGFKITWKKS